MKNIEKAKLDLEKAILGVEIAKNNLKIAQEEYGNNQLVERNLLKNVAYKFVISSHQTYYTKERANTINSYDFTTLKVKEGDIEFNYEEESFIAKIVGVYDIDKYTRQFTPIIIKALKNSKTKFKNRIEGLSWAPAKGRILYIYDLTNNLICSIQY